MRILCTGDIHIGRRSSRVPPDIDSARFSTAAAWEAVVDVAIRERVDLLALSGDVVDRANRYFEAFGPLERGLRQLAEAGIDTVAVSGNHDFDVLPQLQRGTAGERLRLLGQGGQWERWTLHSGGEPALHVDGWSFPSQHVRLNPLDTYLASPDDDLPVLGLLHADLDQPASPYAPVALSDLDRQRVSLWLLGHIHHPSIRHSRGATIMYPGSPQAMDPGETGPHGPWLVEMRPGERPEPRQALTSLIRYEALSIPLDGIEDRDALQDALTGSTQRRLAEIAADCGDLLCVAFRVTLSGRTALHSALDDTLIENTGELTLHSGQTQGVIERLVVDTRPALALDDLAKRSDPPGALARTILALEADDYSERCSGLIDGTLARMNAVRRHSVYSAIVEEDRFDGSAARDHLLREGYRLLDTLVAQREGAAHA